MRPVLVVGLVVAISACERAPSVRVPHAFKGGFLMQCLGVTDFLRRGPCAPERTAYMHNNRGGCVCAQGGGEGEYFTLPPVVNGRATSALPFNDGACTTTYASACVPRVAILSNGDWNEGIPGQLRLDTLADRTPDRVMKPFAADLLGIGTNDLAVAISVANEAELQMVNYCSYAHFGVLAERLFPGVGWRGSKMRES